MAQRVTRLAVVALLRDWRDLVPAFVSDGYTPPTFFDEDRYCPPTVGNATELVSTLPGITGAKVENWWNARASARLPKVAGKSGRYVSVLKCASE